MKRAFLLLLAALLAAGTLSGCFWVEDRRDGHRDRDRDHERGQMHDRDHDRDYDRDRY
jgi:hypothetical protein